MFNYLSSISILNFLFQSRKPNLSLMFDNKWENVRRCLFIYIAAQFTGAQKKE